MMKRVGILNIYLAIYVDDLLCTVASAEALNKLQNLLKMKFNLEITDSVEEYAGMEKLQPPGKYS